MFTKILPYSIFVILLAVDVGALLTKRYLSKHPRCTMLRAVWTDVSRELSHHIPRYPTVSIPRTGYPIIVEALFYFLFPLPPHPSAVFIPNRGSPSSSLCAASPIPPLPDPLQSNFPCFTIKQVTYNSQHGFLSESASSS